MLWGKSLSTYFADGISPSTKGAPLGQEDGTTRSDNPEVMMLAGIKANLQHFSPEEARA